MDQNKHNPESGDHDYLFAHLDKLINDANISEASEADAEVERIRIQSERESKLIDDITGVLDDMLGPSFYTHYGDRYEYRREASALEIMYALSAYDSDHSPDEINHETLGLLMSLNGVVLDAAFTELTTEGFYEYANPKREVQVGVLTNDGIDAELKKSLIDIIDSAMPGPSLDTSDPDLITSELSANEAKFDQLHKRIRSREVVREEFARFDHLSIDPEYRSLMSDVYTLVANYDTADEAIAAFGADPRLQLLGIGEEYFAMSLRVVYETLDAE